MRRSSSSHEQGSALIEALVIGSFVFIVVVASVASAIDVALGGGEAQQAARTAAVHAARHAGPMVAIEMVGPGFDVDATREGDTIAVHATSAVALPHPDGLLRFDVGGTAEMPLAPFRSDRG